MAKYVCKKEDCVSFNPNNRNDFGNFICSECLRYHNMYYIPRDDKPEVKDSKSSSGRTFKTKR